LKKTLLNKLHAVEHQISTYNVIQDVDTVYHTSCPVIKISVHASLDMEAKKHKLLNSRAVYDFIKSTYSSFVESYEMFAVLYLNKAGNPMCMHFIKGTKDAALISIPEMILQGLLVSASKVILIHNHPSGLLVPSTEDKSLTKQAKSAFDVHQMYLLDHIIITVDGFFSFTDEGLL